MCKTLLKQQRGPNSNVVAESSVFHMEMLNAQNLTHCSSQLLYYTNMCEWDLDFFFMYHYLSLVHLKRELIA